jgi:hypothetical protein
MGSSPTTSVHDAGIALKPAAAPLASRATHTCRASGIPRAAAPNHSPRMASMVIPSQSRIAPTPALPVRATIA